MSSPVGRSSGWKWWVALAYTALLAALGVIAYQMVFSAEREAQVSGAISYQPGEQITNMQTAGAMNEWPMGVTEPPNQEAPYDPWANRPRVSPAKMPEVIAPPARQPDQDLNVDPQDYRYRNPRAARGLDRSGRRFDDCRCRRPSPAPAPQVEAPTPDLIPESVGMGPTTLPISSQP